MAKKKRTGSKTQRAEKSTPKRLSKKALIITVSAAAAVTLAILLVFLNIGPVDRLEAAAEKTFFADNFTTMFDLTVNGEKVDGVINASINRKNRTVDMYMSMETQESNYVCGIYKTDFMVGKEVTNDIYSVDITKRLDSFFNVLENKGTVDWQLLLNIADTDLHSKISEDFDFDKLLQAIGSWLNQLNRKKWAKTNAGYTVSKEGGITTHSFRPDPYTLVSNSIPTFKSSFRENSRYEQLETYTEDAKYLFVTGKTDFNFRVERGYLIGADFEIKYNNTHITGNFSFIGINATIVDTESIAFYIEESKK